MNVSKVSLALFLVLTSTLANAHPDIASHVPASSELQHFFQHLSLLAIPAIGVFALSRWLIRRNQEQAFIKNSSDPRNK